MDDFEQVVSRGAALQIRNLLSYWRHCLADGELSAPPWWGNESFQSMTLDALRAGRIDPDIATMVVDGVEQKLNDEKKRSGKEVRRGDEDWVTIDQTDVVMTPFLLQRRVEHGQSQGQDSKSYAPFWIAARLSRDGSLSPHPDCIAWFVREHLEPSGKDVAVVGLLAEMDSFLSSTPEPISSGEEEESIGWAECIAWAEAFCKAVTGVSPWEFELDSQEEYETLEEPGLLPHSPKKGPSRHLLELYDALLRKSGGDSVDETSPRLLGALAREVRAEAMDPDPALDAPFRRRHLGQMTDSFGLGPSQRESLHALFRLGEGELMASNGPPGTGKTAWIQSAVASLWVERALEGGEPPIVVATSANNRAVTNILDTFQKASPTAGSGLEERWLPGIGTYGLFLPSGKQSKTTSYCWAAPDEGKWKGRPEEMENWHYLQESEEHYLERAGSYFGTRFREIVVVAERLRAELRIVVDEIADIQARGEHLRTLRGSMPGNSPEALRKQLTNSRGVAKAEQNRFEVLARDVDEAAAGVSLMEELLAFLPPIRERRNHRFVKLFRHYGLPEPSLKSWSYRKELEEALDVYRDAAAERLAEVEAEFRSLEEWEQSERDWLARLESLADRSLAGGRASVSQDIKNAQRDPRAVEPIIDRTLRRQLFLLAGRYWEGRWLLDLREVLEHSDEKKLHRQSRADCLRRFRRFAMVTPLFVSTVYMLPKFFDCFELGRRRRLIEDIDLLIVEEAGQVAPELGGVLFALARRAVVLGDVFQMEPIWGIGREIDDANRQLHQAEAFEEAAFRSSQGSLMAIARLRTRFTARERSDGLWLREHRRCLKGVIAYCQELVPAYGEMLQPLREGSSDGRLPALGWANVLSASQRLGRSYRNKGQAGAIVSWLVNRQGSLEKSYGKPLHEIVGIVTPYRPQVSAFYDALRVAKDQMSAETRAKIEIGTVHTFQGGELPVMIFSPVVTPAEQGKPFFDRGVNMLNVAVSRAQDSFLVFGDMRIFDPDPRSRIPSGILARHLFAEESNELLDVESAPELPSKAKVERISGLEAHRRVLNKAFEEAQERLLIVSPYLTERAVEAAQLIARITGARARVSIAYSTDMAKRTAREVADRLEAAGADVIRLRGFHTKTLAVDDAWFTHGSFNWLSAVREEGATFQYHEASLKCGPPAERSMISEIWEEVTSGRGS